MTSLLPDDGPLVQWYAQTVECADAEAMAAFYVGLMGGRVTRRREDRVDVEAGGLQLSFHSSPDYRPPTWPASDVPTHRHFDFVVEDLDVAVKQVVALGARFAGEGDGQPHRVVLLDPSGQPFCLIDGSAAIRH